MNKVPQWYIDGINQDSEEMRKLALEVLKKRLKIDSETERARLIKSIDMMLRIEEMKVWDKLGVSIEKEGKGGKK